MSRIILGLVCLILVGCAESAIPTPIPTPTPTPAPVTPQAVAEATIAKFGCEWVLDKYHDGNRPHGLGVRNLHKWVQARGGDVAPFILIEDMERTVEICKQDT